MKAPETVSGETPPSLDPVRQSLKEADSFAQHHTERMRSLIRAAKSLLRPDRTALMDVHELLDAMAYDCDDLENSVNYEAERHGCNYVDHDRRARNSHFAALVREANHA